MVTSSSPGSSSVWDFFTETEPGKRARCEMCSLCLPLVKGQTTGLRHHLQWAHKLVIEEERVETGAKEEAVENTDNTVKWEPREEENTKADVPVFAGKPADLIYQYLSNSLLNAKDATSDVRIQCSDGSLSAHKLVLASVSKMLYEEFKENDWDETVSVIMPEYSVSDISKYLQNVYKNKPGNPSINKTLGGGVYQPDKKNSTIGTQTDEVLAPAREPRLDELMFQDDDDWFNDAADTGEASTTNSDGVVIIKFMRREVPLPSRSLKEGGRANVSFVWDHFTRVDHEKRLCNHCGETLTVSKGSTWKLRTHIMKEHNDKLSEDYKDYLKRDHNIDVDSYELNGNYNMPSENVVDPETGELLGKRSLKKKTKKVKKKKYEEIWEHFKVDPENPHQTICKICSDHIDNENGLMTEHLKFVHDLVHQDDVESNLLCSHCGLTFESKADRNKHEGQHRDLQFWCTFADCSKGFDSEEKLTNHTNRKHTGEKPYACDVCSRKFFTKGNLKCHMRKHNLDRPFQCNECGKAFGNRGSLKTHMRVHSDDMPYECEDCHQRFKFPIIKFQHKCPGPTNSPYYYTNDLDFQA